jgi:hypothetical protein
MRRTLGVSLGAVAALATVAAPAIAAAPHASSIHKHFTETESGIQLSVSGNRFEDSFKIKASPFGVGTVIRDAAFTGDTFPASGKDTATSYYKDGRLIANETLTYGAPLTDGVGTITGTGTCSGGTFNHQGETCTYTIKGSYDLITSRVYLTLSGTYTPMSTTTKKK